MTTPFAEVAPFLTDERVEPARGTAENDLYRNLLLMLPEKGSGFEALDLGKDRGKELQDVEQGPGRGAGEKP